MTNRMPFPEPLGGEVGAPLAGWRLGAWPLSQPWASIYYAVHLKNTLEAAAINVRRPKPRTGRAAEKAAG